MVFHYFLRLRINFKCEQSPHAISAGLMSHPHLEISRKLHCNHTLPQESFPGLIRHLLQK